MLQAKRPARAQDLQQTAAESASPLLQMLDLKPETGFDFPDDPLKWDGWSKYRAANPYERLCFAPNAKPNEEQILQHSTALMRWWQRKLPLKNQPTNPVAAAPGSIRGDYGLEIEKNLVHGSDSGESAARELALFFPEL
jgi:hypothetical protein